MIPENITRGHVLKAIEKIKKEGVPPQREPTKFWLKFNNELFPPKYVISIANKYANEKELEPSDFSGGDESNKFLIELGFEISKKSSISTSIWMEKTYYKNREHRKEGELALGTLLASPQKDRRGADIYKNMRSAKRRDLVLHLIDKKTIVGISKIKESYEKNLHFTYLRKWDNQEGQDPGYKVILEGFVWFEPPIDKSEILKEENRDKLESILVNYEDLFYDKNLNLRQGAYLTSVPNELMQLINDVYRTKTGKTIPYYLEEPNLQIQKTEFCGKSNNLLKNKKQIILYGPPGTGKTFLAQKSAVDFLLNQTKRGNR